MTSREGCLAAGSTATAPNVEVVRDERAEQRRDESSAERDESRAETRREQSRDEMKAEQRRDESRTETSGDETEARSRSAEAEMRARAEVEQRKTGRVPCNEREKKREPEPLGMRVPL